MRWFIAAAAVVCCIAYDTTIAAARPSPSGVRIAFVPLDDRPATSLFPQEIAAICGAHVVTPPRAALGHFWQPGDRDAIGRWLLGLDENGLTAVVISTDMLAYGGLVASREPATSLADAAYDISVIHRFHDAHPAIPVYAFGTIMRLAPTMRAAGEGYVEALTRYAQIAGLAGSGEAPAIEAARAAIPDRVLWDYLGSRARDEQIDRTLLGMVSAGDIALLSLTQDDAGAPGGLQTAEDRRLRAIAARLGVEGRVLLNPGTDEMGAVMVMRAIEDAVGWAPSVRLAFPSPSAARESDPLEYLPIGSTVSGLAAFLKMQQRDDADFELAVNVPADKAARDAFADDVVRRLAAGGPTAVADVSFIAEDESLQPLLAQTLELRGVAADPLAFASWNTTANTTGTALAQAAATLIGRRFNTLSPSAAATFLYERYVDDYAYRLLVRPALQARLAAEGANIYGLDGAAGRAESLARSALWPLALSIFDRDFKTRGDRLSDLSIYLPWQRTFEVRLDASVKTVP